MAYISSGFVSSAPSRTPGSMFEPIARVDNCCHWIAHELTRLLNRRTNRLKQRLNRYQQIRRATEMHTML
jgi:hypothetical protein